MNVSNEFLSPSFLNAGELFLTKYLKLDLLINKATSDKEIFYPSTHKYNSLLIKLRDLKICIEAETSNEFRIRYESINNFSIKQILAYKYISKYRPPWYIRFRKGRNSLIELKETNKVIFQSLCELGLFDEPLSEESARFISEIRALIYSNQVDQREKIETGIFGEKLSMQYELNKTGNLPIRESLNNEYAGYDLISFYSDNQIKRIEVKASKFSKAFITWNEWKTALNSIKNGIDYEFHFWQQKDELWKLAILKPQDLSFMGDSHNDGHHWDKYIILFDAFKNSFKEVDLNFYREI